MPVRKFRSVEDLPGPPAARDALAGLAAACALSELSTAFGHRWSAPRGVRRFRCIEEAEAYRRDLENAAMARAAGRPPQVRPDEEAARAVEKPRLP